MSVPSPPPADARAGSASPRCVWRGDFGSSHSLAIVNDGVTTALEAGGGVVHRLAHDATETGDGCVGIAAHWPPDFYPPSGGPFVLYQPWEFGRIPRAWADAIRERVDEVWVPSAHVRDGYVASGIAPELVHVVPNGVDLERFTPDGPARRFPTGKSTVFLFVGGTIPRKGIDVLLSAYAAEFSAADDVCLAIKGFCSGTFYRAQTGETLISEFRADPEAPEVIFIDEEIPFGEVPSLYRAADVLVQPYRAEGFCLPALEALACGVPLIVTAGGPTDEFVSDACAWRIPATGTPIPAEAFTPEGLTLTGTGFFLEPDQRALASALREATDPAARAARAAEARRHAEPFSWDAAAGRAAERIAALTGRTPIREIPSAAVPGRRRFLFLAPAEWSRRESWAPALHAYVTAFTHADDVTLLFPSTGADDELALLDGELEQSGRDAGSAPDIALADPSGLHASSLALAADAVICVGEPPSRARLVLPPDPAALRAALTAQEAA